MAYTSALKIREELLGVDYEDAPDDILEKYIVKSDKAVIEDISTPVTLDEPSGAIDGINKEYQVTYYPIADRNADGIVDASDVTVRAWKKSSNVNYDTMTVSSVLAEKGYVTLSTAPSKDTYDKITADYRYYSGEVDYTLIELASSQYAAFLWLLKEHSLMPLKLKMGGRRGMETSYGYTVPTYPYDKMIEMYYLTLSRIRAKLHKMPRIEKVEDIERELDSVSR